MGLEPSDSDKRSLNIDQSGQQVDGHQVNVGGDATIDHVGDKIRGDVVISGMAGVGKMTLAAELARR